MNTNENNNDTHCTTLCLFCIEKVQNVVLHFVKQNRRVLVVGSSPLKAQARNKRGAQTPLGALMDYLLTNDEQCGVLCLAER